MDEIYKLPLGLKHVSESGCIIPREGHEVWDEYLNMAFFINDFYRNNSFIWTNKISPLRFINWGYTGLVYVMRIGNQMFAITINQPSAPFQTIDQEYHNLVEFGNKHPNDVVKPEYHYSNPNLGFSLYISPYIDKARCISNNPKGWGIFIPEPRYRFRRYSPKAQKELLPCLIAKLILLYDDDNKKGIASCKTIDGDFMLDKRIDYEDFNTNNIMNRLKLVSIRDTINVSLDEYKDLIRTEFSTLPQDGFLINTRSEAPIPITDIEKGIEIGLSARENNNKVIDDNLRI